MRTTRSITAAVTVLIAALACTAVALAKARRITETATAPIAAGGSVLASLSYTAESFYDTHITLDIGILGASAGGVQQVPLDPASCTRYCQVGQGNGEKAIHVLDIQGNGVPDVIEDLYTGGAHCCSVSNFYVPHPSTGALTHVFHIWGDPGYRLEKLGGRYLFDTADDRFAYEFTDFAASGLPLALLSFNGTALVNVTRRYPKLIRRDAAIWLGAFNAQRSQGYADTVGVIGAWAADEDELGNGAKVAEDLNAQAAAGHLNSGLPGVAEGAQFVRQLDAFLKKTGYLK